MFSLPPTWAAQFNSLSAVRPSDDKSSRTMNSTLIDLAGLASVSVLFVSILLYFTWIERRLGGA
jgi:hypothetical protein